MTAPATSADIQRLENLIRDGFSKLANNQQVLAERIDLALEQLDILLKAAGRILEKRRASVHPQWTEHDAARLVELDASTAAEWLTAHLGHAPTPAQAASLTRRATFCCERFDFPIHRCRKRGQKLTYFANRVLDFVHRYGWSVSSAERAEAHFSVANTAQLKPPTIS